MAKDYRRDVSPLVNRLKLAVLTRESEELKNLLKNRLFEMTDDDMDALMWQLPPEWIEKSEEKLGLPFQKLFSHKASLLWAVERKNGVLLKAEIKAPLRASCYASAVLVGAKLGVNIEVIRALFDRSCQSNLWDAGTALPLLYEAWVVLRNNDPQSAIELLYTINASRKKIERDFLHFGAKTNNVKAVESLLEAFGKNDVKFADRSCNGDETRTTPLQRACYHGQKEVVGLLLSKNRDSLNSEDHRKRTALHFAAEQGWHKVVEKIVEYMEPIEKHINKQDRDGLTPLHLAAGCSQADVLEEGPNHLNVVKILLDNGADVNIRDLTKHQDIYLETYLAISRDKLSIEYECFRLNPVMSVFWSPGGFTALHFAIIYGRNCAVVQKIVEDKNCENIKDEEHLTAVDWAQVVAYDQERTDGFPNRSALVRLFPQNECNHSMDRAESLYIYSMKVEKLKREIDWIEKMGSALRSCNSDVAHMLIARAISSGIEVGFKAWEHLKWAVTKADDPIETEWASAYHKPEPMLWNIKEHDHNSRDCLQPPKCVWKHKVQEVILGLLEGKIMCNKVVLQNCLLWAMRQQMYELALNLASHVDCEVLEKLEYNQISDYRQQSPIKFAASWQNVPWGPSPLRQILHVMENREEVHKQLFEDRKLYVDYLQAILVASVLMAGLAFQSYLQAPHGVNEFRGTDTSETSSLPLHAKKHSHLYSDVFICSNHISFFFSMIATFTAILAAIPNPSGELVYTQTKIRRAVTISTLCLALGVVFLTVAFTASALDLLILKRKLRQNIKIFSYIIGGISSLVLLILVHYVMLLWGLHHKFLNYLASIDPLEPDQSWMDRCVVTFFRYLVEPLYSGKYLHHVPFARFIKRLVETLYGSENRIPHRKGH